MAESVISFAVQTIGNLLAEEARFLHGVKDQFEELREGLKRMKWFLKDADAKKGADERIREWILEVKDIAYDAEDLVERYAFRVQSSRDGGLLKVLNRCVCVLNDFYSLHIVGLDIQALNTKILRLEKHIQTYGIRERVEREGSSSVQQQLRRTYSFAVEEDFVGLESDVDLLVKHLVTEDQNACRVVSITGLGGLGKTTIAKKVYKHPSVKHHFDGLVWICVSQEWQAKEILQNIMIKLAPEKGQEIRYLWSEDELKGELYKIQQEMKCLIVLDDIWTTDAWDCIKAAFPTGQKGAKILLTSRNRNVAMHIGPDGFHHQPRLLSDDESWDLLRRKALRTRHDEANRAVTNEIGNLFHLRFLSLRGSYFYSLPSSLGNLRNLQTLDLRLGRLHRIDEYGALTNEIGNLLHLRYLSLRGSYVDSLPSSLGNLKNLQTLDLRLGCRVRRLPNILGKLDGLICLYLPEIDDREHKIKSLGGLKRLEKLYGFHDDICETEDLLKLANLRVLHGICYSDENQEKIENYKRTNTRLEHVFM